MHRKQRTAAWLLGLISTVSGLACTSTQTAETGGSAPERQGACFNVRGVDSFSPLSDRFVFVRVQTDRYYLLTLDAIYPSLPYATGIAISGNYAWVCSNIGAMITYVDAGRPVLCRILSVEAVASLDEAKKLVAERTPPSKPKG